MIALLALVPCVGVNAGWRVLWEAGGDPSSSGLRAAFLEDVDGDGRPDVLLVCRREDGGGRLSVLGAGGAAVWRRDVSAGPAAACVDLDGDGASEIVVAWGETLAVLDGRDGSIVSVRDIGGPGGGGGGDRATRRPVRSLVVAARGDGRADAVIAVGAERGESLAAYRCDTLERVWTLRAAPEDGPFGRGFDHVSAGDANGDGVLEVLATENMNRLLCIDAGGGVLWSAFLGEKSRFSPEGVASAGPIVADLTGDGANEVAVGCFAGALVVLDGSTGQEALRLQFGRDAHGGRAARRRLPALIRKALESSGEPIGELAALDLDGRPGRELVFGCSDGRLYAVSARDGRVLWARETPGDVYDAPVALDDGAPDPCVLAWSSQGIVACGSATGAPRRTLDAAGGAAYLLVGDVAGDERPELILVGRRGRSVAALVRDADR